MSSMEYMGHVGLDQWKNEILKQHIHQTLETFLFTINVRLHEHLCVGCQVVKRAHN